MSMLAESFLNADLPGVRTISVTEDGGATWYDFSLTATATVQDALTDWQTQLNASGDLALTYTLGMTYSTSTVTFSASGSFDLELTENLWESLGFNQGALSPATSFTSTNTPKGFRARAAISYEAPTPLEEVSLTSVRWNRGKAYVAHYGKVTRVVLIEVDSIVEDLMKGPLFAGKLRLWTDTGGSGAYALGNTTGYLDVYPFHIERVETSEVLAGYTEVSVRAMFEEA